MPPFKRRGELGKVLIDCYSLLVAYASLAFGYFPYVPRACFINRFGLKAVTYV